MATLLISLGTTPAIVPEAFRLPGVEFEAVHVLTTNSGSVDTGFVLDWFARHTPRVALSITRVEEFRDFTSEDDHFRFEEVLCRWYFHHAPKRERPHVCLSGGFKTMSAAMQKAAAVLGVEEVFHVLADSVYQTSDGKPRPASTFEEIQESFDKGHLHWIRLGSENGWPQLKSCGAGEYPLETIRREGGISWVKPQAPDSAFRDRLREIVERSHNIAGAWDAIGSLPFPILATWPAAALDWLRQPLDPDADRDWIASLPKVELHCHLGGFATHGDLLGEVRAAAERPELLPPLDEPVPPASWPLPTAPISLPDYMRLGDASGSALLKDPGCLRRQCELLHEHLLAQNILHAEIRCSPANYAAPGRSPWTVLREIKDAFDVCMAACPGCHVNLILIATRKEKGDYRTAINRHLTLAITAAEHWADDSACRVVGVDLAGYEDKETRAHLYRDDFRQVHRAGLALTVHAGENDDAEGIWSAVFDLNTRRIGHALTLIDSLELLHSVAARGIGVEMCPYANYQIKGFRPMQEKGEYPLKQYLDAGVAVTLNTDNIGISAASLTDNFLLAARLCPGLTRLDALRLLQHSVESAFLSPTARDHLRGQLESKLLYR